MGGNKGAARVLDADAALTQAQIGVWEYRPETSLFDWSDIIFEIFGLPPTTKTDLASVAKLYPSESSDNFIRAIDLAAKDGKPFALVSEITTVAGQRKWIRTQGQGARRGSSAPEKVVGTIQDISAIRVLDRVTQDSELTLNQVEQITHIGHWSVSLEDGSFYHSDEIKRIFGYEPAEYALSVEEAINAYHPDDRAEVVRLFNRAVETGESYEFDLRIVQPSGELRYVHSKGYTEQNEAGKVTRVYGIFQDVTERELTELALRQSEQSMNALVDAVHTAIVVHDKDGAIILSNQMANRLLAPIATDLVGKSLDDSAWKFVDEDAREIPVQDLPASLILRNRKPVENLVLGRRDHNSTAWLLVNGMPVVDEHGSISKVIVSFVDITERKQMEERLHQSEKMKAIGQLAGGVAHDFNNQLTAMLTYAEILKATLQEDSQEISYVKEIISGVRRSADLTRQLLAFARKGKYVVTTVDINRTISDVVSMAVHTVDRKIRVVQRANANPATVAGDGSQLQNAILNMALNARDAMPNGGELVFATDRVALEHEFLKDGGHEVQPGQYLRITIRDSGIGMDAETQKHMFEPFFTTKAQGKGVGMGMASVYGTVKNHHGAIEVESEPNRGTEVRIYLPFRSGETEDLGRPALKPRNTGGQILIIDDETMVAESLSTLLKMQGYRTTTCSNGREALEIFRESWQEIDIVLLDMIMPEVNGVETFYAMREIDPNVKVVLISGFSLSEEAKKITEEGAGFLSKPVSAEVLFETISEELGKGQRPD